MTRWWLPAALAALGWLPAPTERPVPFRTGETLSFDVSWSQYLTAGTATMTVHEKRPSFGATAYYIAAEGRPSAILSALYTLYYKADTLLETTTLLPQRASVYSEEGSRKRMKAMRFNQATKRGVFEVTTSTVVRKDVAFPPGAQDPLSAIYVLRSLPLKSGASFSMPVVDNGTVFRMDAKVAGHEVVNTPLGRMPAWKIVPVIFDERGAPTGHTLGLWISDDARKLPVKLDAELPVGHFVIVLKEVRE